MLPIEPINLDPSPVRVPRSFLQRLTDAKHQPAIEPLVGDFWFVGELHILFADTGIGKSILATQLADALTKGQSVLSLATPARMLRVLLLDFELSDRQLEARYVDKDTQEAHAFSELLHCDGIDFMELGNEYPGIPLDQSIILRIREFVMATKSDILIIDNISYLSMQSAQETQVALELMKSLVDLKKELGISILVLAHTPKIPAARPVSINDLAGSKHLANFADSVSGLGRSCNGADVVYWKQVKPSRSGEHVYDADNVVVLHRKRLTPCFLGFAYNGTDSEYNHLKIVDPNERLQLRKQAVALRASGLSLAQIASKLLNDPAKKTTIAHWLKNTPSMNDPSTVPSNNGSTPTSDALHVLDTLNALDGLDALHDGVRSE